MELFNDDDAGLLLEEDEDNALWLTAAYNGPVNVGSFDLQSLAEAAVGEPLISASEVTAAIKPFADLAATGFIGSAWGKAYAAGVDDAAVFEHHATGCTLTLGDFRRALGLLQRCLPS